MDNQAVPSLSIKLAFVAVALLSFALFTYLRGAEFGTIAAFSVLAISVAAYSCWYLHQRPYFWPLLAVVAVVHVVFLLLTTVVLPKPTIMIAPIVFLDFIVIVALLIGADRLLHRSVD
jgi:hypothetical protein